MRSNRLRRLPRLRRASLPICWRSGPTSALRGSGWRPLASRWGRAGRRDRTVLGVYCCGRRRGPLCRDCGLRAEERRGVAERFTDGREGAEREIWGLRGAGVERVGATRRGLFDRGAGAVRDGAVLVGIERRGIVLLGSVRDGDLRVEGWVCVLRTADRPCVREGWARDARGAAPREFRRRMAEAPCRVEALELRVVRGSDVRRVVRFGRAVTVGADGAEPVSALELGARNGRCVRRRGWVVVGFAARVDVLVPAPTRPVSNRKRGAPREVSRRAGRRRVAAAGLGFC